MHITTGVAQAHLLDAAARKGRDRHTNQRMRRRMFVNLIVTCAEGFATELKMPRRKPLSTKQRKAQLQEKRAIKRGEVPPKPLQSQSKRRGHASYTPQNEKITAARKLQSAFVRPSPSFLDLSKQLAATVPLQRPLPHENIYLPSDLLNAPHDLDCPRRPKWRYDMTKKEVEINEERQFGAWLKATKSKFDAWRGVDLQSTEDHVLSGKIRSPSYFELNLEVWRQLWAVFAL